MNLSTTDGSPGIRSGEEIVDEADRTFAEDFRKIMDLWTNEKFCDLKLKVGAEVFPVHRNVLVARIPYFRAMFSSNLIESTQSEIEIKDLDPKIFRDLLEFAYTGRITIPNTKVETLINSANYLGMEKVMAICSRFLIGRLELSNIFKVKALADRLKLNDLLASTRDFMLKYFYELVSLDDFFLMEADTLADLLKEDSLQVYSEEQVYETVMRWFKYDVSKRKDALLPLFSCIRLPLMDREFLLTCYHEESIRLSECRDWIDEAIFWFLIPNRPSRLHLNSTPRFCYGKCRTRAAIIAVWYNCSNFKMRDDLWVYSTSRVKFYNRSGTWKLQYGRIPVSTKSEDYLGLYLSKGEEIISEKTYIMEYEVSVISQKDGVPNIVKKGEGNIIFMECFLGTNELVRWAFVMNPENGYLKNDTLILQGRLKIKS